MAAKQVVFVRGGNTPAALPWMFFHFDPKSEVALGTVKLVYFDYPAGKVKIWNKWVPKRSTTEPSSPDKVSDIAPRIYVRFDDMSVDRSKKLPSILGLYDYVKKQPRGSIASLQIFGHGDYDGPILWKQSFEDVDKEDLHLDRDPHDTEFRRRDFFGKNPLAGAEGDKFSAPFRKDALVKVWGCISDSKYRVMLRNYLREKDDAKGREKKKAILESYLDVLDVTYARSLSGLLKLPVWAAPVGWGTNPWGKLKYKGKWPPDIAKERWWVVPVFTTRYRRFYTDVLGAQLDATRFVGYRPSWIAHARAKVALEEAATLTTPRQLARLPRSF